MNAAWRRTFRVLAYAAGGLALVLFLLHTPPAKEGLRRILVAATGGRLQLGEIDYRLWRGEIQARDVAWTSPTLTARVPDVLYRYVLSGPDRIAVRAPELDLALGGEGSGPAARFAIPAFLLGRAVAIDGGAFRLQASWGTIAIRSIDITLTPTLRGWEGRFDSRSGTVRLDAFSDAIELDGAEANLTVSRDAVEIAETRASIGPSSVSAEGTIGSFSPFSMALEVRHDIDGELLARIATAWRVQGNIEGDARLSFEPGGSFRAEGTAVSQSVVWDALEPIAAAAVPWRFEGDLLEVNGAELEGYGGSARLTGTIDFASNTQSLEASATNIELGKLVPPLASRLSGSVSAHTEGWTRQELDSEATLELAAEPSAPGLPLRGRVVASTERGVLHFDAPDLRARSFRAAVSGRFDEALDVRYQGAADELDELPLLLQDLDLETPDAPLSGSLSVTGTVTGPPENLVVRAVLLSPDLHLADVPLELEASVSWTSSRLALDEVAARQPEGGTLLVEGALPTGEGGGLWDLTARAQGFDLSVTSPLVGTSLGGSLGGEARVTGPPSGPEVEATFDVRGLAFADAFEGDVSGTIRERDRKLEIVRLSASRNGGELELAGQVDLEAETMIARARGTGWDLAWIPPLARAVPELHGTIARMDLDVEGHFEAPEGQGSATLAGVSYRGVELPTTTLELRSDGETARVEGRLPDGGELLTGEVELGAPYPARVEIDVARVPWTALLRTLPEAEEANARLEIEGTAELRLPLTDPGALSYTLAAASALATYRDLVFGASAPFSIRGDLETLTVEDLTLVGADTAVGLDGVVPLSKDGAIDLAAKGAMRLEMLHLWIPDAEPAGSANASLRIQGTLSDPTLEGDVVVDEASFVAGGVPVRGIDVAARWIDNVLVLQHASGSVAEGSFQIHGEVAPRVSGEIYTRLEFEVGGTNPASLVETDLPFQATLLSLSGEIEGDLRRLVSLSGKGAIDEVAASTDAVSLASDGPAPWTLTEGALSLPRLRIAGGSTDVVVQAEAYPFAEPPAWSATVEGVFDHGLLSPLLADTGVTVSGLTRLSVTARKGAGELELEGQGSWSGARVAIQDPPLVVTNLTGGFELAGDRLVLEEVSGTAGGGQLQASGEIALAGASVASMDLKAEATQVRLSYPEGLRSELDANLTLTGTPEAMRLSGEVTLDRAVFSRNINVETELLRSFTQVAVVSAPSEIGSRVRLDLQVKADDALRIDNNLAQVGATANLTVTGTLAAPELYGVASTQPGGRFRFGRNLYQIETGRVQFRGYPQQTPEIDVTARTSVAGHDLRLQARGPVDNLVTTLDAPTEPTLSRADVASLLVTGRTVDKISEEGRTVLGEQMASYLGATLADLAQLGLGETLPFQIVTVEPALIAREADPGTRFTLGAAFTDDLTVVYSIGLNDAEDQIWIVDYGLPKRTRAQMIRQSDNEFTFGMLQQIPVELHGRLGSQPERRVVARSSSIVYGGEDIPEAHAELDRKLRPRPGSRYDYWQAWKEADRIREKLRAEGFLESTADVVTTPCGEDCVDVRYIVELGLPVAFRWEGEVDTELGDALAESWNGRLGESFLTSDLEQLAEGELFARGYFLARAEASTQRTDQGLTVTVAVDRGPRGNRVSVAFRGNEGVGADALLAVLPERRSSAFYELLTVKRPRLKQLLRLVYASQGYLGAEIQDPETRFDATSGVFQVTIPVFEGPRYRVEAVELTGVSTLDEKSVLARLPLRADGWFRATDFVDARSQVAAYYRQQGFPDVEVEASVLDGSTEGSLRARFAVEEGARATVGSVTVAGNDATRESVIRREVTLEPGEPLRLSDVSETQKKLYDLDVFRSAEVEVAGAETGGTSRDVQIKVVEAADLRFDYGLRAGTDGFWEVLGEVNVPNAFGRAQHAGVRTLFGTERKIFRFNYHSPYLSRYRLDTDFFLERGIEEKPAEGPDGIPSTDGTWRFTAQQTRSIRDDLTAQWSYSYRRTASDYIDPFEGPTTLVTKRPLLSGSLIWDARDSVVRPTRGLLWSATLQGAPRFLRSYTELVKFYGQLFAFVPLGNDVVWASAYRFGAAKSTVRLYEEDRFQAGGPNTLRAFEQGKLGPLDELRQSSWPTEPSPSQDDFRNARIGGSGLLVVNQEIRFPLFWRIRGTGFWDAGNVFESASDISLTDLRHDVGIGVRIEMGFGLLRLDWAWVLGRLEYPDEVPQRFVFSLGHAF